MTPEEYMRLALAEARKAAKEDEVPVGAVLLAQDGAMLAKAHNQTIGLSDPTAHAEILAIRAAARIMGNYRLVGTTLYVTIEPCIMCMGALLHARVKALVYGAWDPKWGGAGSCCDLACDPHFNHTIEVRGGILEKECRQLMQAFFQGKRLKTEG